MVSEKKKRQLENDRIIQEQRDKYFGENAKKEFVAKFNQHCKENNLGSHKFHQDFYAGPFSSREIDVRVETVKYKGRIFKNQPIIFGLDLVTDDLTFTDDV